MQAYQYTECGLDNVFIEGLQVVLDDDGEEVYTIPRVADLHRAIAAGILRHKYGMSGDELRFLRTEMGMTQAELSKLVHVDKQTIGRWERGETEIGAAEEALIRRYAMEVLNIDRDTAIAEVSARCVPSAMAQTIRIDGSDPERYEPLAA